LEAGDDLASFNAQPQAPATRAGEDVWSPAPAAGR